MPTGELADAALILVGGVLLMLPGFITDIFGFLFLLPFTRPAARSVLGFVVARRVEPDGRGRRRIAPRPTASNLIPGEIVDPPHHTHRRRAR